LSEIFVASCAVLKTLLVSIVSHVVYSCVSLKPGSDGVVRNATMVSSVPFSADVSYFEIGLYQSVLL